MLKPIPVELWPHDPTWAETAARISDELAAALGERLVTVHHIGSTSVPGIVAKPIIDLLPIVRDLAEFDAARPVMEGLGFSWHGEFGLPGRRYCIRDDPETGRRLVQAHCYALGDSEIDRHVAFRDYLRANSAAARAYEAEKVRCAALCPESSYDYNDCKNDLVKAIERDALRVYRGG